MRDTDWVIIELSEIGEAAEYEEIELGIRDLFGDKVDYFIPTHNEKMGSYKSTSVLIDGYVFVRDGSKVRECLVDIKDHRVFSRALGNGKLHTIDSRQIGVLKRKLKQSVKKRVKPGKKVKILEGIFENLVGEVVGTEDDGRKVLVKISRPSREMIAPIPSTSIVEMNSDM